MEIVLKELKKVVITTGVIDALALTIGLLCRMNFLPLLVSLLFGSLFTNANFYLRGTLCRKACTKTPEQAKRFMQLNYTIRLLLTAVVITAGFKLPYLNPLGVALPLFAPKLTYFSMAICEALHRKKPVR